jgi:pleiotropic regulator 1
MALTGHTSAIDSLVSQGTDPQVISGSADSTIRCWDLRNGKPMVILTNHKKSVRSLVLHPTEFSFASGAAGWSLCSLWMMFRLKLMLLR